MFSSRFWIFLTGISIWGVGCTVGPDYVSPEVEAPETYQNQAVLDEFNQKQPASDSKSKPESSPQIKQWWTGFGDPLLNQLVETALQQNYQIAAAQSHYDEAKALLTIVDSENELEGRLENDVDARHTKDIDPEQDAETSGTAGVGVGFSWALDISGRNQRAMERARAVIQQRAALLKAEQLSVSTRIALAYLQMIGLKQQLVLLQGSLDLQKQTLRIVRSRFKSGISPELDLERARAAVASLQTRMFPLEIQIQQESYQIAVLSRMSIADVQTLLSQTPSKLPQYQEMLPVNVPLKLLQQRPNIRAAEEQLKQAVAEIGIAESEYYPQLNLLGGVGIDVSGLGTGSVVTGILGRIGASIDYFLFDGGAVEAGVHAAKARAQRALAEYQHLILEAISEVETTLVALKNLSEQRHVIEQSVQANLNSVSQADTLYRQGLTSFLDVIDAQRTLASDQQNQVQTQTAYNLQIIRLFRALGIQSQKTTQSL